MLYQYYFQAGGKVIAQDDKTEYHWFFFPKLTFERRSLFIDLKGVQLICIKMALTKETNKNEMDCLFGVDASGDNFRICRPSHLTVQFVGLVRKFILGGTSIMENTTPVPADLI